MSKPKVVMIGGGTGSFSILSGLKDLDVDITALVNMLDDGGSTGELRDKLGVLPPGDVRQCLVALSNASDELRQLFNFRFPEGSEFSGHSVGNLFLSGTELMTGNFSDAVKVASKVLNIHGTVLPITSDNSRMILTTAKGKVVEGQFAAKYFDAPSLMGATISFDNLTRLNEEAEKALLMADAIVLAAGDLYTSLAPALSVVGLSEVLRHTHAKIIYICNLVNKPIQTLDYSVDTYADEVERLIGYPVIDHVLYNTDLPSELQLKAYALEGEYPVLIDEDAMKSRHYSCVGKKLLADDPPARNANDSFIYRSLIRHDPRKVADQIAKLL